MNSCSFNGLSIETYKKYMHVIHDSQESSSEQTDLASRCKACFPIHQLAFLRLVIVRLCRFIWKGFSQYPDNAYLFQKFKEHQFKEIKDKDECTIAKRLCEQFKKCCDYGKAIAQSEIEKIATTLNEVEQEISGNGPPGGSSGNIPEIRSSTAPVNSAVENRSNEEDRIISDSEDEKDADTSNESSRGEEEQSLESEQTEAGSGDKTSNEVGPEVNGNSALVDSSGNIPSTASVNSVVENESTEENRTTSDSRDDEEADTSNSSIPATERDLEPEFISALQTSAALHVSSPQPILFKAVQGSSLATECEKEVEQGSYIYTQFYEFAQLKNKTLNNEQRKTLIQKIITSYWLDWAQREGSCLQFNEKGGSHSIKFDGGKIDTAHDWVTTCVNLYKRHLRSNSGDRDVAIANMKKCKFVGFLKEAFPKCSISKILSNIIQNEIDQSQLNVEKKESLEQLKNLINELMVKDQFFGKTSSDVCDLTSVGVLYVMLCLGQATLVPLVDRVMKRMEVYDDGLKRIENREGYSHVKFEKRHYVFKSNLDLTIAIDMSFLEGESVIAQGRSELCITSLQGKDKVLRTDLKELKLREKCHLYFKVFLKAQLNPSLLTQTLDRLVSSLDKAEAERELPDYWLTISRIVKNVSVVVYTWYSLKNEKVLESKIEEELIKKFNEICQRLEVRVNNLIIKKDDTRLDSNELSLVMTIGRQISQLKKDVEGMQTSTLRKVASAASAVIYNCTLGMLLNETTDSKFLEWKVKRYEKLVKIAKFLLATLPEKLAKLPARNLNWDILVDSSKKRIRCDSERFTPEYLEDMRKLFTEGILGALRALASMAIEKGREDEEERLVYFLCHSLYTEMNINHTCQGIVHAFKNEGKKAKSSSFIQGLFSRRHSSPTKETEKEGLHPMLRLLPEVHEEINWAPSEMKAPLVARLANSARGTTNGMFGMVSFDPNKQSNPMHQVFQIKISHSGREKTVRHIAMGSPTIENGWNSAVINPEFRAHLKHCKYNKLRHLYVNVQNYIPGLPYCGDEAKRCDALHALADDFKGTFDVVTLNQNGKFYHQKYSPYSFNTLDVAEVNRTVFYQLFSATKGAMIEYFSKEQKTENADERTIAESCWQLTFAEKETFDDEEGRDAFLRAFHSRLRDELTKKSRNKLQRGYYSYYSPAEEFNKELIRQVFDEDKEKSGNCIPDSLRSDRTLRNWSERAIVEIHRNLFEAKEDLTIDERKIFIRLFYQVLTKKILAKTDADFTNSSCKDRIDRGAATSAEEVVYLAIIQNRTEDKKLAEFLETMIFSRAIIVRKRSIIDERLERMIETADFLLQHQENVRKLHQAIFPDVTFELKLLEETQTISV